MAGWGTRIQKAREDRGWTQGELAGRIKPRGQTRKSLTDATVSRWESESAEQPMYVEYLLQLVRLLELAPAPLLRDMGFAIPLPVDGNQDEAFEEAVGWLEKAFRDDPERARSGLLPLLRQWSTGSSGSGSAP